MQQLSGPRDASPAWLDTSLYPFTAHWFDAPDGAIHYGSNG